MQSLPTIAFDALAIVLSWPNILYPVAGTLLAMIAAALPGVSGVSLVAVMIPLTFFWEPLEVALFFGALVGGATFMGSVSAILLNVPGRASNAATALDGYPLSQQGKARTAIAASATASALGSTFGIIVLLALMPVLIPLSRLFGPFDLLMAITWGLSSIVFVTGGSWSRALIMTLAGLALAMIGPDHASGEYRFHFGIDYFREPISPILVFLGVFAVSSMIELWRSRRVSVSGSKHASGLTGSVRDGILSVFRHFGLFLRSSVIGTLVGIMPGVGAVTASMIAYGHAAGSRDNGQFGKGDIRGVIAPEAANDAKDGGALIPTLAIGLPGGLVTALLLTTLGMHGLHPGPGLLTNHLDIVFVLIWSLFISNWLSSLLGLGGVSLFARVTTLPAVWLAPAVLVVVAISAWSLRQEPLDVVMVFLFGLLGYAMKTYHWPRVPFIIALVLGPSFENNLSLTLQLMDLGRISPASSPAAMVFLVLIGLILISSLILKRDRQSPVHNRVDDRLFAMGMLFVFLCLSVQVPMLQYASMYYPAIILAGGAVLATWRTLSNGNL